MAAENTIGPGAPKQEFLRRSASPAARAPNIPRRERSGMAKIALYERSARDIIPRP